MEGKSQTIHQDQSPFKISKTEYYKFYLENAERIYVCIDFIMIGFYFFLIFIELLF